MDAKIVGEPAGEAYPAQQQSKPDPIMVASTLEDLVAILD
jgi:hypothetical protein